MLPKRLAFVDVETTGTSATYDRIIEIAIIIVEGKKIVDSYSTCVNPQTRVSPFITGITGITQEELEYAPTFEALKRDIYSYFKDSLFVAHNARFDYGFLKNEFERVNIEFKAQQLCTVKLSRALFPQFSRHNLDSLIERFNLKCDNRHRAYSDAQATVEFYFHSLKEYSKVVVEKTIKTLIKKPSLPSYLAADTYTSLPEKPGVYILYGKEDIPLYVGKSVNIKNRISSHFASDHSSNREMRLSQQTSRIKTIATTGELSALIKESELIKTMQPMYNRRLRKSELLVVAKKKLNSDGYYSVDIETVDKIDIDQMDSIIGIFKTKKKAKDFLTETAKTNRLCTKLLRLEKTFTSCFLHKINICKGACVRKEKASFYNLRFTEGFIRSKIKQWPFDGIVEVTETSPSGYTKILIDRWCLFGFYEIIEDDVTRSTSEELAFDYDLYSILLRYLLDPKNSKNITIKKSPADNTVYNFVS